MKRSNWNQTCISRNAISKAVSPCGHFRPFLSLEKPTKKTPRIGRSFVRFGTHTHTHWSRLKITLNGATSKPKKKFELHSASLPASPRLQWLQKWKLFLKNPRENLTFIYICTQETFSLRRAFTRNEKSSILVTFTMPFAPTGIWAFWPRQRNSGGSEWKKAKEKSLRYVREKNYTMQRNKICLSNNLKGTF